MADLAVPRADRPAASAPAAPKSTGVDGAALWRGATWPLWAWSDVPAPEPRRRDPAVPAEIGLAGEVFLSGLDRVRNRLWVRAMLHGVFRGAWLALMGATVWMAWSLLAGGPELDLRPLGWAVGIGAVAGLLFGIVDRPSRRRTAAMLDRTFGLRERLTTAVEDLGRDVPAAGEWARVPYLQMADSANAMDAIRRDPALAVKLPVREIVMAVFFALALASLAFLRGVGGEPVALVTASVPKFVSAAEAPVEPDPQSAPDGQQAAAGPQDDAPSVEQVRERSRLSAEARQDLQALADALGDHAVTKPAADAIARGDYERAADALRDLAPNAGELSPQSREGMASDLEAASDRMSDPGSGLREASTETAQGLRQGDRDAREGLRSLAEAVEQAGDRVAPQSELADQMRRAQQGQQGQQARQAQAQPGKGEPGSQVAEGKGGEVRTGDPGEGADASGQQASGEGQQGESGQQGQGERGSGQQGQPAQGSGANGEAQGQGQGERGSAGAGDDRGDSAQAAQGGGAGSGEGTSDSKEGDGAAGGDGKDGTQAGQGSPEQRVSQGDGARGEAGKGGEVTETIALPPGQQGPGGVQTSADGGSALLGTGAGVTAGSGSAVQGEVGESGPDSNHVPAEYRDLVQDYFSGQEGS